MESGVVLALPPSYRRPAGPAAAVQPLPAPSQWINQAALAGKQRDGRRAERSRVCVCELQSNLRFFFFLFFLIFKWTPLLFQIKTHRVHPALFAIIHRRLFFLSKQGSVNKIAFLLKRQISRSDGWQWLGCSYCNKLAGTFANVLTDDWRFVCLQNRNLQMLRKNPKLLLLDFRGQRSRQLCIEINKICRFFLKIKTKASLQ